MKKVIASSVLALMVLPALTMAETIDLETFLKIYRVPKDPAGPNALSLFPDSAVDKPIPAEILKSMSSSNG